MATRLIHGIAVEIEGSGGPVVCIHGLGGSSNLWMPLAAGLSTFRQIRVDLPFSARSGSVGTAVDLRGLTECVHGVIAALEIPRAHFLGHSMGSLVCFELAARWPALVASLALFAPLRAAAEAARPGLRARADAARAGGAIAMQQVADQVLARTTAAETRSRRPAASAFIRESIMRQPAAGYAAMCDILAGEAAVSLDRVACPVLLVGGDEDPVAPPAALRAMAAMLNRPTVRILDNCGHWPTVERPEHCIAELADFRRRLAN
jgi:3-oxoadipate enol-lactonase